MDSLTDFGQHKFILVLFNIYDIIYPVKRYESDGISFKGIQILFSLE